MNYSFSIYTQKPQRVDMYLSALFWEFSRSYIQKLIDTWCVRINGKIVKKNLKIQGRDQVFIQEIISSYEILPENMLLDIIYEDENLCVINKEAGINTHPVPWIEWKKGTLVNGMLFHCREKLPVISGEERPGIVHRLDKDTSWAIMVAKNDQMMHYLSDIIRERKIKKYYIAIVAWIFSEKTFTIKSQIGRHPTDRIKMTTLNPVNPKHAVTHGEVLWYISDHYSILKIDLETGRTHQIRVHLASIWYPIIGDSVYGNTDVNDRVKKEYHLERQALHAYSLDFELYSQKQSFVAPLKDDIKDIIPDQIEL